MLLVDPGSLAGRALGVDYARTMFTEPLRLERDLEATEQWRVLVCAMQGNRRKAP